MSHSFVVVLTRPKPGQSPKDGATELLAPFEECLRVEFEDKEAEWQKEYETGTSTMVEIDGAIVCAYDKLFHAPFDSRKLGADQYVYPNGAKRREVPHRERFSTFDAFVRGWQRSKRADNGHYGYWYNPKARWDWWTVGGRWDRALLGNAHRYRDTDNPHHGDASTNDLGNIRPVRDIPIDDFSCFAILTPEGEWIERGEMGWWGVVKDDCGAETWTAKVREILSLPRYADCVAVGVDVHI